MHPELDVEPPPTPPPNSDERTTLTDHDTLDAIHAILIRPPWSPETLQEIARLVQNTGRQIPAPIAVAVEVVEALNGQQIAYVQTEGVDAYVSLQPGEGVCFDIHTRSDPARAGLQFVVDGRLVPSPIRNHSAEVDTPDIPQARHGGS
ncbi:hypothetical protein OG339_48040 (plasmid) [Streptosporangium sp. NBC_01495]|uniref:hypothetical protein n=1 Tax=Streptosporangium sp. NBC_01495 TaxID=2903899 RepID=UPI002E31C4EE|nr:hypothetical protein [Streptosporangium sp. NBC_01495]